MKIATQKTTWMTLSCVLALASGAPAMADDTELLLVNPDPSQMPKPNVMFILDTSGSMKTEESTVEPYDSNLVYPGACDTNAMYWTDVDITPTCDAANNRWFAKAAYMCEFSTKQIAGIGSYTDTMVMYRSDELVIEGGVIALDGDSFSWNSVVGGLHDSFVECQADSGTHGDGTPGLVYARRGTDRSSLYSDDPKREISWGSAPANWSYTVYDGNYLNWKAQPNNVIMTRSAIMKVVTKKVLSSVNNLNVGLQRFNDRDGGPVILAMTDLDANRQAVLDAIESLPAGGRTPLSETLYENALYWRGMPAHYGELINETPTDPNALVSFNPEVYLQPTTDSCAKNYNVLLTDGEPVDDYDTPALAPTLPNFSSALGRMSCTGTAQGDCLDDT